MKRASGTLFILFFGSTLSCKHSQSQDSSLSSQSVADAGYAATRDVNEVCMTPKGEFLRGMNASFAPKLYVLPGTELFPR